MAILNYARGEKKIGKKEEREKGKKIQPRRFVVGA